MEALWFDRVYALSDLTRFLAGKSGTVKHPFQSKVAQDCENDRGISRTRAPVRADGG